ncbi:MAG: hypothetical protein ABSF18_04235 [Gammaproteobacteria bacterium]|jgi:hypothetical protein
MTTLVAIDFDGTVIVTNSTSKFWQERHGVSTVDMAGGLVVLNQEGIFCYKNTKQVLDMSKAIPQDEIDRLLNDKNTGLKEPELLAQTIIHAIDNNDNVAIVTKSLYPEIVKRALEIIFEKHVPDNKKAYLKQIHIVCGYPVNEDNETGKRQHIEAAEEYFVAHGQVKFDNRLLLDDDPNNIAIHKKYMGSYAVQANSSLGSHTSYSTVNVLLDRRKKIKLSAEERIIESNKVLGIMTSIGAKTQTNNNNNATNPNQQSSASQSLMLNTHTTAGSPPAVKVEKQINAPQDSQQATLLKK